MNIKLTFLVTIAFIMACQNKVTLPDAQNEEKGILDCIKAETKSWVDRDSTAWLNCYAQLPTSSQAWNNRDGTWDANRGWKNVFNENIKGFRTDSKKRTDIFEIANHQIQMCSPEWAWVTYDQTIRRENGREMKTFESRLMNKAQGTWKLVANNSLWNYAKTFDKGDVLKNQKGIIVRHETSSGSIDWLIETNLFETQMKLFPIGLPDKFKKEGLTIEFDGEFLYGKHQLYKPGAEIRPVPDVSANYVRIDLAH